MSSFKEVRELLLVAYDSEIINDEEFLVLFENYRSRNLQFPYNGMKIKLQDATFHA